MAGLERCSIRIGVASMNPERILAHQVFPPGASIAVGSKRSCQVRIPEEHGLGKVTIVTPGPRLKLRDKMHLQANVAFGPFDDVPLRGAVAELRRHHLHLDDEPLLVGHRVLIRYKGLSILLDFSS